MSYTFPSVVINNTTYTAKRWGQFPTISLTAGGSAGSEVVTVASDLSNVDVKISDGVSTNAQIKTAVANAFATVESLMASDLITVVITAGHESDAASATSATPMTGAVQTPAPTPMRVLPSNPVPSTVIDWSLGRLYSKTLSANTTFIFVNSVDGMELEVALTNTASNYTVTWPAGIKWVGGSAPTQTVGAKTDVYRLRQIGTTIYCTVAQNLS